MSAASQFHPQAAILLPPPLCARHLEFDLRPGATRDEAARALARLHEPQTCVDGTAATMGLGPSLTDCLGVRVPGLRDFPKLTTSSKMDVPSTPHALWIWVRGEDRGEVLLRSRLIEEAVATAFDPASIVDAFRYDTGRDLTGYEDGTENPKAEAATEAAIVANGSTLAPAGSSFVAIQLWQHDLARFRRMTKEAQDALIGRERITNEELDDAPAFAHTKRTAQESFDPPAFVVRKSMPWADATREGLVFVSFGRALDAFENQLRRMAGIDDGILDGVFSYSTPLSGAYYWCPPVIDGRVAFVGL